MFLSKKLDFWKWNKILLIWNSNYAWLYILSFNTWKKPMLLNSWYKIRKKINRSIFWLKLSKEHRQIKSVTFLLMSCKSEKIFFARGWWREGDADKPGFTAELTLLRQKAPYMGEEYYSLCRCYCNCAALLKKSICAGYTYIVVY